MFRHCKMADEFTWLEFVQSMGALLWLSIMIMNIPRIAAAIVCEGWGRGSAH